MRLQYGESRFIKRARTLLDQGHDLEIVVSGWRAKLLRKCLPTLRWFWGDEQPASHVQLFEAFGSFVVLPTVLLPFWTVYGICATKRMEIAVEDSAVNSEILVRCSTAHDDASSANGK